MSKKETPWSAFDRAFKNSTSGEEITEAAKAWALAEGIEAGHVWPFVVGALGARIAQANAERKS